MRTEGTQEVLVGYTCSGEGVAGSGEREQSRYGQDLEAEPTGLPNGMHLGSDSKEKQKIKDVWKPWWLNE